MSVVEFKRTVLFEKDTPVYVINTRMTGYVVSPLRDDDGKEYLAVRLQNKQVILYRFPEDVMDNIYPLSLYQELIQIRELGLLVRNTKFIKSQYRENIHYSRISQLTCIFSFKYEKAPPAYIKRINKIKAFAKRYKYILFILLTVVVINGFIEYGGLLFHEIPSSGTGTKTYIHFSSKRIYNHSVGGSWTKEALINGHKISHSAYMYLNPGDSLILEIEFRENDKVDDIGRKKIEHVVTAEDIDHSFSFPYEISVYENRGRYSGAKCLWKGSIKFF